MIPNAQGVAPQVYEAIQSQIKERMRREEERIKAGCCVCGDKLYDEPEPGKFVPRPGARAVVYTQIDVFTKYYYCGKCMDYVLPQQEVDYQI